jgi:hypothetical protein
LKDCHSRDEALEQQLAILEVLRVMLAHSVTVCPICKHRIGSFSLLCALHKSGRPPVLARTSPDGDPFKNAPRSPVGVIGQPLAAINLPGIRPRHDLRSRHRLKQPKRPQRGTLHPPATKGRLGRPEPQNTLFILLFVVSPAMVYFTKLPSQVRTSSPFRRPFLRPVGWRIESDQSAVRQGLGCNDCSACSLKPNA